MNNAKSDHQAKLRQWELMRAYRSLDPEKQREVLAFVLALAAAKALRDAD